MELCKITSTDLKKILPTRLENSNKGSYGHVLNVSGAYQYRGAAFLSSYAAYKVGAGLVHLACPDFLADFITSNAPEIVFEPLKTNNNKIKFTEYKKICNLMISADVLMLGCGLSTDVESFALKIVEHATKINIPLVLDADGLNILAKNSNFQLPQKTILTPHPKELSRLLDTTLENVLENRIESVKQAAKKFNSIVILKGHNTLICDNNKIHINKTGNSALAKAGTGDVLTGIIAGMLAQGATPLDASLLGVYLHGLAGDLISKNLTNYSTCASDLFKTLPLAIKTLF